MKNCILSLFLAFLLVFGGCGTSGEGDKNTSGEGDKNTSGESETSKTSPLVDGLKKGLVAHYPFDGNASDMSGNGHHAKVLSAKFGTDRFFRPERCLSPTGENIALTSESGFNFSTSTPRTMSFWLLAKSFPYEMPAKWAFPNMKYLPFPDAPTGRLALFANNKIWWGSGNGLKLFSHPKKKLAADGTWHHIVCHYSGSLHSSKIYVDGTLLKASSLQFGTKSTIDFGGESSLISCKGLGNSGNAIDEVRIYDRALTAAEIKALYDSERAKSQ